MLLLKINNFVIINDTESSDNMSEKIPISLTIFIFTPILVIIGNIINIPRNLVWYIPNIIMIYIALKNIKLKNVNSELKFFFYLFMILNFISCLLATNKMDSFLGSNKLIGYITLVSFMGYFDLGSRLTEQNLKLVSKILLYVATVISLLMIIKMPITYKIFNLNHNEYYFYQGPFNHFNHTGYYLLIASVISIFLIISEDKKRYYIINAILIYTLILNDTFGVYVAYTITLIFIIIYNFLKKENIKKMIIIIATFILASIITYRNNENIVYKNVKELIHDANIVKESNKEEIYSIGTDRGKLWINGLKIIKNNPLIGVGLENAKYEYQKYGVYTARPHNIILELAIDSGIPSLIIYIVFIIKSILKSEKKETNIMCIFIIISYIISAMFGNITMYVTPYYYLFLGIIAKKNDRIINNNTNS